MNDMDAATSGSSQLGLIGLNAFLGFHTSQQIILWSVLVVAILGLWLFRRLFTRILQSEAFAGLCRHPIIAATLVIALLCIGLYGSLYGYEIRRSFDCVRSLGPGACGALLFVFVVFLIFVLYYAREYALARQQNLNLERQENKLEKLEILICSMPPEYFMAEYGRMLKRGIQLLTALSQANVTQTNIKKGIRYILRDIATLAQRFDWGDTKDLYAANLMRFVSFEPLRHVPSKLEYFKKIMVLKKNELDIKLLPGVLYFSRELSACAASEAAEPWAYDGEMPEMALPIHDPSYAASCLPGAPFAFIGQNPVRITTIENLMEWCNQHSDYSEKLKNEIRRYFDVRPIESFISIPVFKKSREQDEKKQEVIGVLNIQSNRQRILTDEKNEDYQLKLFIPLMDPFLFILAELMQKLTALP